MCSKWVALTLIFLVLLSGFSSASATPPAKILSGVVSNVVSALVKWLWSLNSLKTNPKTAVSSRSMMKFEGGYTVETVFDGSKLGIEPYLVEISPSGDLLVLDSENSNIYKISTPLSRYSRPRLVAGSAEGYPGHVDGKLRESRMHHPKGLTVDDRGNIYIADTMNMAIRKISDGGVTTIAGGQWTQGGGHVDGPSEDAKFSDDFDVVYVGSSCSLLVIDRGNQAIREIELHDDDCNYPYDGNFHLGIAVLVAAVFFGYMMALLQRRVQALFSSHHNARAYTKKGTEMALDQRPPKSVRPPLIPNEDEAEEAAGGLLSSLGRLVLSTVSTIGKIVGGLFLGYKKRPSHDSFQQEYRQALKHSNSWPVQESFMIPDEDEPPSLETINPTPKKTYPFMTEDVAKTKNLRQSEGYNSGWDSDHRQMLQPHKQQKVIHHREHQQLHQRRYTSDPKTYHEKSCEANKIVFGAVQEQAGRCEAVVIKAVDYGDPRYDHHNIRSQFNYVGYSHGY